MLTSHGRKLNHHLKHQTKDQHPLYDDIPGYTPDVLRDPNDLVDLSVLDNSS